MCKLVYGTRSLALSPSSAVDHKNLPFDQLKGNGIKPERRLICKTPTPSFGLIGSNVIQS